MSVKNATLLEGPTISITAGTSKVWTVGGQRVVNGIQIVDTTATDYRTRPHCSLRSSEAVFDKTGLCTVKAIRRASMTRPKILASGAVEFPNLEIVLKRHPESTDAEILELKKAACQLLLDTDFDNFWKLGSTE